MNFSNLTSRALEIRQHYEQLEASRYGRSWNTEEIALGFMGDVGDLAKLIQAEAGVRNIDEHRAKLGHELADCLWSIIVLAEKCNIDLESEFLKCMDELEERITNRSST